MSERASEARPPSASLWFLLCFHAHTSCGSRPPIITFLLCVYAVCVEEEEAEVEGRREARPPFVPSLFCFRRLRPRRSLHPWRDRGREEQSALQTRAERGRESGEAALSLHFTSLSRPLLPLLSSVGRPFLIALEGQTSEQREIEGDGVRRRVRVHARAYVRPGVNMP